MILTVVISPENPNQVRGVYIQDESKLVVAVMNARSGGWEKAAAIALDFVEAANTKAQLIEALETIKSLRIELSARDIKEQVKEALYPAVNTGVYTPNGRIA
jgi:hypothetical protein